MGMINVLKWEPAPHVFAYKYPSCQLTHKSQLIVSETQEAVLVKEGLYYGPITPGRHVLETKNFPFLTKISASLVSNAQSPYSADVWFVQKAVALTMKWGTNEPILLEDPGFHIAIPIRAFGQYGMRIIDTCRFLALLSGRLPAFTEKTLSSFFKGVIMTRVKTALATLLSEGQATLLNIGARLDEISEMLEKRINEDLAEYGLALEMFVVNSISTDENDIGVVRLRTALAKKAEMNIIGYTYEQERSVEARKAFENHVAASIYCKECGAALSQGSRFCSKCGAKIQ